MLHARTVLSNGDKKKGSKKFHSAVGRQKRKITVTKQCAVSVGGIIL